MASFKGVDYLHVDDLLTDEERMVRNTVRDFVDEKIIPIISDYFERGELPEELIPQMADLGLFGPMLPDKYGCSNVNYVTYGLIMQELERGDSGIRSFCSVQSSLAMFPIYMFGSEEQKDRWLPPMARGEAIGCFGLTEPDHGSNPAGMITRAKKDGDSYILNGAKMWITNGSIADICIVWAKLEGKVRGFLVEKGTPGFSAPEIKHKMSLRASITSELIFDDCRIPAENILPKSDGLKAPLKCLDSARYGISWGCVGAAMACYDAAKNYAMERIQFDKPIAGFQLVQRQLVDMLTEITKAQLLCLQVGRLKDAGQNYRHQFTSMAKMNNASMALKIARAARDIHGANGITLEYPVIRHMNNLESVYTYEGTNNVHKLILGMDITGLNAFK